MEQEMNPRFIRIAELIENLENVSKMIDLHRQVPQHESMVNQYELKRVLTDELGIGPVE